MTVDEIDFEKYDNCNETSVRALYFRRTIINRAATYGVRFSKYTNTTLVPPFPPPGREGLYVNYTLRGCGLITNAFVRGTLYIRNDNPLDDERPCFLMGTPHAQGWASRPITFDRNLFNRIPSFRVFVYRTNNSSLIHTNTTRTKAEVSLRARLTLVSLFLYVLCWRVVSATKVENY